MPNRRNFLFATTAAAIAFSSACGPEPEPTAPKPPNILFAFADDWGRYASIYRDPARPGFNDVFETPNIDRVGREGVVFRNAFVGAPSCTPSRAAVTSGMYFYRNGRQSNLRIMEWSAPENAYDQWPGFPALLQAGGYHVGHADKTSAAKKGEPEQKNYSERRPAMSQFSQTVSDSAEKEAAKSEIYEQVRGQFDTFLSERQPDQPFFYWFGPHNTHRAWVRGSGKALWGIDPDTLNGKLPAFLPDVPEVREDVADYLGEVKAWDAMIGVLLAELERIGELDNTLIVLSGDHGMPGMPYGKCNVYDFGVHAPLLARWGKRIPAGRFVDDFVQMMDVAPTFLEAADIKPPETMQARSLLNVLTSDAQGTIDSARNHVVIGRERHVWDAREDWLPYPTRAIRTNEYLYIRNFKPERWPMGSPLGVDNGKAPSAEALASDTMVAFKDWDASPTKAWIVAHRNDKEYAQFYQYAVGKRPEEELYDLKSDPDQVKNVAAEPAFAETKLELSARLMQTLEVTGDPRLEDAFDREPYVEPASARQ